jgi:hypothetical protein
MVVWKSIRRSRASSLKFCSGKTDGRNGDLPCVMMGLAPRAGKHWRKQNHLFAGTVQFFLGSAGVPPKASLCEYANKNVGAIVARPVGGTPTGGDRDGRAPK